MFGVKQVRKQAVLHQAAVLVPAPQVSAVYRDGRAVLMDLRSGRYFGLDPVGARIFELIELRKNPSEIIGTIEQEYDAPPAQLRTDAMRFMSSLISLRLVQQ